MASSVSRASDPRTSYVMVRGLSFSSVKCWSVKRNLNPQTSFHTSSGVERSQSNMMAGYLKRSSRRLQMMGRRSSRLLESPGERSPPALGRMSHYKTLAAPGPGRPGMDDGIAEYLPTGPTIFGLMGPIPASERTLVPKPRSIGTASICNVLKPVPYGVQCRLLKLVILGHHLTVLDILAHFCYEILFLLCCRRAHIRIRRFPCWKTRKIEECQAV